VLLLFDGNILGDKESLIASPGPLGQGKRSFTFYSRQIMLKATALEEHICIRSGIESSRCPNNNHIMSTLNVVAAAQLRMICLPDGVRDSNPGLP
jgi:hypothetical protein